MNQSKDFIPIRVSTLRGDQKINFDLYIPVAGKHILYIRRGFSFEAERIQKFKDKKIRRFFITPEDENFYRNYIEANIEMAYSEKSKQSIKDRCEIAHGLQQAAAEAVMENPEDEAAYKEANSGAGRFAEFVLREQESLKNLLSFENAEKSVSNHSANVATLAVTIAQKLKVNDPEKDSLLVMGSLVHDLEHHYNELDIARPLSLFSSDEMAKYKQHPADAARRVHQLKHFHSTIIKIVLQHEESIDGSGYPNGIRESEIDPLALIVSTANAFDRMTTFEGISPKDAIKSLLVERVGLLPLTHIKALGEAISEKKLI